LNPNERLKLHLKEYYGSNKFTTLVKDWEIFYQIECETKPQSLKIEKHIKRMKSKKFIQKLKKFPEITFKLLEKYN
jgi:putative endonuclease